MTKKLSILLFITTFIFLLSLVKSSTTQAAGITLGILGDSNTDEYRADDNRGGAYSATTLNWAELLVKYRNVNLGAWGTWGEPRRSGYKYNWSRSGATSGDMVNSGQHRGLAQQIANGEVSNVIIFIGSNDFNTWNGTYADVYNGTLSGTALTQKINSIVTNITTAVDTLQAAGQVRIVLTDYPDPGLAPDFMVQFPDATKRQRVTGAITKINEGLTNLSSTRNISLLRLSAFASSLLSKIDSSGNLTVGNEKIIMTSHGDEPHHAQLNDSVGHSGTVLGGLIANYYIPTMNSTFGWNITLFTDQEILNNAGIHVSVPTQKVGDANGDNKVDGLDYVIWLNNYGTVATQKAAQGDFNLDTKVDGLDYVLWLNNYS